MSTRSVLHLIILLFLLTNFVQAQLPSIPIDFESPSINYQFITFGGVEEEAIVPNPQPNSVNNSPSVFKFKKQDWAQTWGGVAIPLDNMIDFGIGACMEMSVFSPRSNVPILFKIEDTTSPPDMNGNPSVFAEISIPTISNNTWETLLFDFDSFAGFNPTNNYNQLVIFADFGNNGIVGGETYYFDNVLNYLKVDSDCPDVINVGNYTHTADMNLHAENSLQSSGLVQSTIDITYKAGTQLCLESGFEVELGADFFADIESCCPQPLVWYEDADGDGFGNPYRTITGTNIQPAGYVCTPLDNTGYTTPTSYTGYNLVWSDEFDMNALDANVWWHDLGDGCPNVCGWGNNEIIWYQPQNATVYDDFLTIEAKQESAGGYNYTSSRIKTQGNQSFQYGRVDIRAKLPYSQGIWPALWMLGESISTIGWPSCGEIDIMELIGGVNTDNTVFGTCHWNDNGHVFYGGNYALSNGIFADQFHVFSIIWDANEIKWLVDDIVYHVIDITPPELSEFHEPFFFIFNIAVGGNFPGYPDATTVVPQKMIVDYVRVFQ